MSAGLLILRVVFGALLAVYGCQKLFGWFGGYGLAGTGAFLEGLRFRPGRLFAAAVGLAEFVGGVLLALGLVVPAVAAVIIADMIVAIVTVHWRNGLMAATNGVEIPLHYAAAALCLALTGPGDYSIDAMLGLSAWWTPQLTGVVLAAGVVGGLASLGMRRPAPPAAHA
jgi:putative oxidoreductase